MHVISQTYNLTRVPKQRGGGVPVLVASVRVEEGQPLTSVGFSYFSISRPYLIYLVGMKKRQITWK